MTVSSDRDEYLPHAPAKVSVAVLDASGKPAATEVALWAVDYGLLSLTNYKTPDVVKAIYARRDLQVLTEDTRERMISRRAIVTETQGIGQGQAAGGGEAQHEAAPHPLPGAEMRGFVAASSALGNGRGG